MPALPLDEVNADVANASIAVDPRLDPKDTQLLQGIKHKVGEVEKQAKTITRREHMARVGNNDGVLEPFEDTSGRHRLREVILDLQSVAQNPSRRGRYSSHI